MQTTYPPNHRIAARIGCPLTGLFVCIFALCNCTGCSSSKANGTAFPLSHEVSTAVSETKSKLEVLESDSADGAAPKGLLIAKTEMPSPGRINAFELAGEFQADIPSQESGGKREIYVIGFVEVDVPSVMLAIDGRTQVLKAGDTFERITVQEINPPRARLSCDGVSWHASILDRRSSANESKKKGVESSR